MKAVLLINLGTPDSFLPKDVFRYLNQFLTDKRVISLPFIQRQLLVRGLIVPFRYKISAKNYAKIWTKEGSPLFVYAKKVQQKLQEVLGENFLVEIAMRYQNPSIEKALCFLEDKSLDELIVIPLFPQSASATTGSIAEEVFTHLKSFTNFPKVTFLSSFYNHPLFIKAIASIAKEENYQKYDHILFSFHGLPEKQLQMADKSCYCLKSKDCCRTFSSKNAHCYSAQCYETARCITKELDLKKEDFTICFQSRLGKSPWIQPYASEVIKNLPKLGKKNILVFCPSFVCDCLETLEEIAVEYKDLFIKSGGESLTLLRGLNDHPLFIQMLKELTLENSSPHLLQHSGSPQQELDECKL